MLRAMAEVSKAVLITGCSTGIGHATAQALTRSGWTVYATARRPETLAELEAAGAKTLALDVTDEASMRAAVDAVEAEHGAVGVLINNAGYSQSGAVETVPMEAVRKQFETNVFGVVALTQLVLPAMRAQRFGKIVNVGSMGGRLTFPGGGFYHATKYSLEALSDALRFEVRGFGIDVVLIEPGLIVTEFGHAATASMSDLDGSADDPYAEFNASLGALMEGAYDGPIRHLGGGPDRVAKAIERAVSRKRSPSRVTVTPSAKILIGTRKLLTDRAWDVAMRGQFPQPR
jgi:NAD(P)-dependent dehydrogenase (short-subunit alcohol dehydrogenase family)